MENKDDKKNECDLCLIIKQLFICVGFIFYGIAYCIINLLPKVVYCFKRKTTDYDGCCCICCYSKIGGASRCKWCAVIGIVITVCALVTALTFIWISLDNKHLQIFLSCHKRSLSFVFYHCLESSDICVYKSILSQFYCGLH